MMDSPFDVPDRESLDGYFAVLFLVATPLGGRLFGWLGGYIGDYALEGSLFGHVSFYAFSIGFGLGALREGRGVSRWAGTFILFIDAVLFLGLMMPAGMR